MAGGLGIGGAAAAGISSGFQMGREADNDAAARAQQARNNARQDMLDAQRTAELQRQDKRQDTSDANAESDRALVAVNGEMEDNRIALAGLAHQYGGVDKIPQSVVAPYIKQAQDVSQRRNSLLNQRYAPIVAKEQQWAADTNSRIQTGQMSMDDLSPADTVRLIQASTRRPVTDFIRPDVPANAPPGTPPPKSKIGQAVDDGTAAAATGNGGLAASSATTLLAPDIQKGTGHVAPDGSVITGKSIAALVPAPLAPNQQPQPPAPLTGLSAALSAATPPAGAQVTANSGPAAAPPPDNGMGGAPDTPAPGISETTPPPAPAAGGVTGALTSPGLTPPEQTVAPVPPPPPLAPTTDPNRMIPVL